MTYGYGKDDGLRIAYTLLTHNVLAWKAQSMVNTDADEGLDVEELLDTITFRG